MYKEQYEELANEIVRFAATDYLIQVRSLPLKKKRYLESLDKSRNQVMKRQDELGENFKSRKYRSNRKYLGRKYYEAVTIIESTRRFFQGDWIKHLSHVDGNEILKKLDEQLEKEGYRWDLN